MATLLADTCQHLVRVRHRSNMQIILKSFGYTDCKGEVVCVWCMMSNHLEAIVHDFKKCTSVPIRHGSNFHARLEETLY